MGQILICLRFNILEDKSAFLTLEKIVQLDSRKFTIAANSKVNAIGAQVAKSVY